MEGTEGMEGMERVAGHRRRGKGNGEGGAVAGEKGESQLL